mgnify:CR=1 FL=1
MTIPNVSAATDAEQSLSKCTDNSIVNQDTDFKGYEQSFEEMQREILRQLDPSYLKTVSMTTLYDTVFEVQTPLIDGLLQRGTYLFVGSPKVGKSFMMAQLAYHVSMGIPLWGYAVNRGTVLYLALEDDHRRLQDRLYRMFGENSTENLYFAVYAKQLNKGLETQLKGFMREHPDTRLIIIDTLQKIREDGGEKCSYASDYEIISKLKRPYVRYTRADEKNVLKADCLIIDCFGLLSSIYRYGEIAYIGGGFGVGIHNTLEAAVYGIPVIFGPKYQKFMEAVQLLEAKGAYSIKDYDELKTLLDRFRTDEVFLRETGTNAGYYVTSNAGATEKIMHMINF